MMSIQRLGWPVLIVTSALLTELMYSSGFLSPIRTLVATWFVLVCPGMAYVRLLNLNTKYIEWTLAAALSVTLTTIVGMALVYSGQWTMDRVVGGIIGVTLVGAVLDVLTWNRRTRSAAKTDDGVISEASYRPSHELGENEP